MHWRELCHVYKMHTSHLVKRHHRLVNKIVKYSTRTQHFFSRFWVVLTHSTEHCTNKILLWVISQTRSWLHLARYTKCLFMCIIFGVLASWPESRETRSSGYAWPHACVCVFVCLHAQTIKVWMVLFVRWLGLQMTSFKLSPNLSFARFRLSRCVCRPTFFTILSGFGLGALTKNTISK